MPEATTICPQCGNELAPDTATCPTCGAAQAAPVSRFQATLQSILATTKTHTMWWAGGAGGVLVVAIAAIVAFGGFFGPSGNVICTATLSQARDFGVISPEATLVSTSAKSTDVKDRKQCTAQAGNDTYVLLADLKSADAEQKKCKDFAKQPGCIKLYNVARSDGMTTYQVREIPPDQTDEALLATEGKAPAPPPAAGASQAAPDQSGFDTETAVDNSAGAAPAQTPPANVPPQQ